MNITAQTTILQPFKTKANVLDGETILKFIKRHIAEYLPKFEDNDRYYYGNHTEIALRETSDSESPNNKIKSPYARSMVKSVKGYMYKPGLINFDCTDNNYLERFYEFYEDNDLDIRLAELGEDACRYGVAFCLAYLSSDTAKPYLKIRRVNPKEIFIIQKTGIDSEQLCAVRYFFEKNENETVLTAEVYYNDRVDVYFGNRTDIRLQNTYAHYFGSVPVAVFQNNEEFLADYEPVKSLIDAYDFLISDQINEMSRFASAYLILAGHIMGGDEEEQKDFLKKLKESRIFEVNGDGVVKFLTKDIPTEFFESLRKALLEELEKHSHIVDFRGESFFAKSGESMKYALLDMENLCGDKEAYFKVGIKQMIRILNKFLSLTGQNIPNVVVNFERNLPTDINTAVDNSVKLAGLVTKRTILKLLEGVGIIDDADIELKELEKETAQELDISKYFAVTDNKKAGTVNE